MIVSLRNLPQHGADDEPVKRQDDCEIDSAEQVVREHQCGRGDVLALAASCDIHYEAKIHVPVVYARHKAGRCFAHDRKYPDGIEWWVNTISSYERCV